MLNRTRNKPTVDTLIIEHSFYCVRNCKGCYQKDRDIKEIINNTVYASLVETVCSDGLAKSIIFSFNEIPILQRETGELVSNLNTICNSHGIQAALACHNPRTADSLLDHVTDDWNGDLYLSSDRPYEWLGCVADKIKGKILVNKQTPSDISDIKKAADSLYQSMCSVYGQSRGLIDEVHLLMPKRDLMMSSTYAEDIQKVFELVKEKTRGRRFSISLDRCVQDTHCGANNTSLVVWPDGSVVGCPYALKADTKPTGSFIFTASAVVSIIDNMREALTKETWNTDRCVNCFQYCPTRPKQLCNIAAEML